MVSIVLTLGIVAVGILVANSVNANEMLIGDEENVTNEGVGGTSKFGEGTDIFLEEIGGTVKLDEGKDIFLEESLTTESESQSDVGIMDVYNIACQYTPEKKRMVLVN